MVIFHHRLSIAHDGALCHGAWRGWGYVERPAWRALAPVPFVVMWATGFVVARLSAAHVEPLTFLAIRFPIARLVVHAVVAGAFLHGGYLGSIYWAVANGMPAGVSALMAYGLFGETLSLIQTAGMAAAAAAVLVVTRTPDRPS